MRGRLKIVALIADMDDAGIEAMVKAVRPDFLQLHGSESARRTAYIRGKFGVPVIKALPVAEASDLAAAADYENAADMLMFDARPPNGAQRARRPWRGLRLEDSQRSQLRQALVPGGRPEPGQCRARHRTVGRKTGGCFLRRGKRARRERCCAHIAAFVTPPKPALLRKQSA